VSCVEGSHLHLFSKNFTSHLYWVSVAKA